MATPDNPANDLRGAEDEAFDNYYVDVENAPETPPAPLAASPATIPPAAETAAPMRSDTNALKYRVHEKLVLGLKQKEIDKLSATERGRAVRLLIGKLLDLEDVVLGRVERDQLIDDLVDDVLGFGPLEKLLRDRTISDILVNGARQVYVERRGVLEESGVHFRDETHLMQIVDRIVSRAGRHVDETSPMVDCRLDDGSRVNVIVPPLSLRGATMSIRRFGAIPLQFNDLLALKMLPPEIGKFLEALVRGRLNLLISGGTGSGKTTMLNALSAFIPGNERIITIEDAAELQLQQRHVVQLQSRPRNIEGTGEITIHDLLINTLRMRPNRIIVGECRGREVLDMLQAMNTGHDGSLTTLHANSPRDALARLEMMIMLSGVELPVKAMRQQISAAIDVIVHTARLQGGPRKLMSISELTGMEGDTISLQEIFKFRELGVDDNGRAYGQFEATGTRPVLITNRLKALGIELPPDMFRERVIAVD